MLATLFTSVLPRHVLFPQRRQFRDRPAGRPKSGLSTIRLLVLAGGGILLASIVLIVVSLVRDLPQQQHLNSVSTHAATDGRAVPELDADAPAQKHADPVATRVTIACAELAREKLMTGLSNYYLQRRLRPGAGTEDVASTSTMTGALAGPGDPATTSPGTACEG